MPVSGARIDGVIGRTFNSHSCDGQSAATDWSWLTGANEKLDDDTAGKPSGASEGLPSGGLSLGSPDLISEITAERALAMLKDAGLITPVIGKGYYVGGT